MAIAGLLAMRPEHLVLDEPTAQLDPAGTRLVGDAIARLAAEGASILVAEQKTDLLAAVASRGGRPRPTAGSRSTGPPARCWPIRAWRSSAWRRRRPSGCDARRRPPASTPRALDGGAP